MKRQRTQLFALFAFLLAAVPSVFSQGPQAKPDPMTPPEILGPQLIAWSHLQDPQPVKGPQEGQGGQSANPPLQEPQTTSVQTVTGTIIQDGGRYVLKVSANTIYQLDDQEKAKRYENKQVRVAGSLDADRTSLHIVSIELIS